MNTLHIRYEGLSPSWVGDAVTGQDGTLICRFTLDESWDEYPIRYMAVSREAEIFDPRILSKENEAQIQLEALTKRCYLMVGVVGIGVKKGKVLRYNSRPCRILVDQGNLIWEQEEESDITAYEQILGRIEEIDETIVNTQKELSAKLDANQGTSNAGRVLVVGEDGMVAPGDYESDGGGITQEADPTVPAWAKQPEKPTYTAQEIGAQPAGDYALRNEIPSVPVQSVNGKTGAVQLNAGDVGARPSTWMPSASDVGALPAAELPQAINTALAQAKASGEFDGEPGKSGVYVGSDPIPEGYNVQIDPDGVAVELATQEDVDELSDKIVAEIVSREQAVANLNERLGQQTVLVAEGSTQEEAEAWLESNGDKTKLYLMPDETFWQYKSTTEVFEDGEAAYKNLLPTATDTDRITIYGEDYDDDGTADGWKQGIRLSSSGSEVSSTPSSAAGFIPAQEEDTLRMKGLTSSQGVNMYVIAYDSTNTKTGNIHYGLTTSATVDANGYTYDSVTGIVTVPLTSAKFGSGFNAIRVCAGSFADAIITINQEIEESNGSTTVIVEKWVSTGHGLITTNYDAIIAELNSVVTAHTEEINELKEAVESGKIGELTDAEKLTKIKIWDKPVYDSTPVTLLSDDRVKPALTTDDRTIPTIYAKYRALMTAYPNLITETNLGSCTSSDAFGAVDILRFDIKEPDGLTDTAYNPAKLHETKPKIIFMSGVHTEWVGVWGLYYAIEEIVTNPEFDDIRRNAHIIVVPCSNPFVLTSQTAIDGWRMSHVNANGVAIHNNFGVDHSTSGSVGEYNYGGTEPYSELETQYIDKIMSDNPDAVAFVSCHNCDYSTGFGAPVIWASSATYHMCNVAFRLIDKLTKAWIDKYGDTLKNAIDEYKINMDENDYRLGTALMSTSAGTEQKNATKYGIQGVNLEITRMMKVFSGNTDGTSEVMTHGAEVYANFMRTLLAAYSYTDKEAYYK